MARYGAGAAPCSLPSASSRAPATARSQAAASPVSARSTVTSPASTRAAQRSDSSRKSAGSDISSAMPSANASGPRSVLFWLSGFSMITFSAAAGPISRGSRYVPPQPGTRPRKHSGSATTGTPEEIVRYVQCSAISSPPPIAAPLTNANDGTGSSPSRRNTAWPSRPTPAALSGVSTAGTPLRSAPTPKMNGLPVTPTATTGPAAPGAAPFSLAIRAATSSSAVFSDSSPPGPNVFGLVWSCPLSSVISASVPGTPNGVRSTSRTRARVTTSAGNEAEMEDH
jgi:hypothetical protein